MRFVVGSIAVLLALAGCSSEPGTPAHVKVGCEAFDKAAVAKALGTTEQIMESAAKNGGSCHIGVGAASTIAVIVNIGPDTEKFGFAFWRQSAGKTGGVRDLSPANGDKAFVAPAPRQYESMGAVLHNGTFYRLSVLTKDLDPVTAANALVGVLEAAL